MNSISAFVAHSFDESDTQLNRVFLDYLTAVTKLHGSFRWSHAEHAEPKHVTEKVLTLLDDANLLIAICTKKEMVVSDAALTKSWFSKDRFHLSKKDLSWKTSDWIIQEIGLAVGRRMHVILLVESGVKTPGELQGTLEYIEFERDAPEKSFEKLLQMLVSISGEATLKVASDEVESVVSNPASVKSDAKAIVKEQIVKAQEQWKFPDYRYALFRAVASKDGQVDIIDEQFKKSDCALDGENCIAWAALKECLALMHGGAGNLKSLLDLYERNPRNSFAARYLAIAYEFFEEYDQAAKQFELTAGILIDDEDAVDMLGYAALDYVKDGNRDQAKIVMQKLRTLASNNPEFEKSYLLAERNYAELVDDSSMQIAVMERLLEIDPTDNGLRFSLAYKYSSLENYGLAAWHYQRIPKDVRSASAWNNLGVAYARLDLQGLAVASYRKSEEADETLAMSNLAYKLIEEGFFEEAKATLDRAVKINDYHKNIDSAKVFLNDSIEKEERAKNEKFEAVKKESDFLRHFGRSLSLSPKLDISGEWASPLCTLNITVKDDKFIAKGTYEVAPSELYKSMGISSDPTTINVRYSGHVYQGAIVCTVSKKDPKSSTSAGLSILGSNDAPIPVLMAVQDGFEEIRVIERKDVASPEFYILRRVRRLAN